MPKNNRDIKKILKYLRIISVNVWGLCVLILQ
jgi:hypothetical protein